MWEIQRNDVFFNLLDHAIALTQLILDLFQQLTDRVPHLMHDLLRNVPSQEVYGVRDETSTDPHTLPQRSGFL